MDRALEALLWAFVVDAPLVVLVVAGVLIRGALRQRRQTAARLTAASVAAERIASALAAADAVRGATFVHGASVTSATSAREVHRRPGGHRGGPVAGSQRDAPRAAAAR